MENILKENRNPFSIDGYLSRKWYFILGAIIGTLNFVFMIIFCKEIFMQISTLSQQNIDFSIMGLLTSGVFSKNVLIPYVILYGIGTILSFINNKKRISDILGNDKFSYIISAIFTTITVSATLVHKSSILYPIAITILTLGSFILLCVKGKISNTNEKTPECESEEIEAKKVVVFWKRWLAYFIDATFILGGITSMFATLSPDKILPLGKYSMLIGLGLTLVYFGIMNSRICKGQTLGKALLGIKVVDKSGNYLSVTQSMIRTILLIICLSLPYLFMTLASYQDFSSTEFKIFFIVSFCGVLFDLLFLFNNKTRQTLHDFATGSFVINDNYNGKLTDTSATKTPIVLSVIFSILLMTPFAIVTNIIDKQHKNPKSNTNKNLILKDQLEKEFNIDVLKIQSFKKPKEDDTLYYMITIQTSDIDNEALAKDVIKYVKNNVENPDKLNLKVFANLTKAVHLGTIVSIRNKAYPQGEK